ncbi:replication initiator [Spongiactinospora sp. 9N601]|uniref:replication initiator n=1 Tax=Spongiactinospora sp. 9N601 TaxID=3375149 RepID=UPI00378EA355
MRRLSRDRHRQPRRLTAQRPPPGHTSAQIRATGGCHQPICLRGRVEHYDQATGRFLHRYTTRDEPDGILRVACKTRRASRCPACAEIYRADTYQLIRAGLAGGKGVPESVTAHPALFITLTAPSFGAVHTRYETGGKVRPCRPRRDAVTCSHGRVLACTARHAADDARLGEPLCPDCYDYTGTVLFNALAPELWRRFTEALRRRFAKLSGLTLTALRDQVTISFAKVAEYQRRGIVHFHAVIRLDGPGGPAAPPPPWATAEVLADAVRHAAGAITIPLSTHGRTLRWGDQLDIRPIRTNGELTEQAVAAYIAKYATKAAECVGTLDRRIHTLDELDHHPLRDHARRLITECLRLGALEDLAAHRLTQWAHMLGFRGHFSTKSRRYSTTLGALRAVREAHRRQHDNVTTGRLPLLAEDEVVTSSV